MKRIVIASICLLLGFFISNTGLQAAGKDDLSGTISISGAFALYPMAVKWSEEFQKLHPKVRIDISAGGAGKGMADALSGIADLGMVSREIHPEEIAKGAWHVALVKDAVVTTVNEKNPALKDLLSKGLKREALVDIWVSGKSKSWGDLLGTKENSRINAYTRSDACGAAEIWAKYLGRKQEDLLGVGVYGDPGIAQAVARDTLAIGYNNINFAYDSRTRKQLPGLRVVPLDLNNNGAVDADENFYTTLDQIDTAISLGKYPSPPARELYFVSKGKPQKKLVIEFLKWALTHGQKFVPEAGYIRLSDERLQTELNKIQGK